MKKSFVHLLAIIGLPLTLGTALASCTQEPEGGTDTEAVEPGEGPAGTGVVGGPVAPEHGIVPPAPAVVGDQVVYLEEDVRIFEETMAWARENRLDTLPIGEIIVRLGERFVGDPYTPYTLDPPGPERVVINLREFDCVTYVESVLAMARLVRDGTDDFDSFVNEVARLRYRDGELNGYLSRLHYFSEWISDNERLGLVRDVTADLGGRTDDEPIDFMSTHSDAYDNLDGRPERIAQIREIEQSLSQRPRSYIPQAQVGQIADRIQDGDVIAATSSVEGLDIAHTGFALWRDGRLHLMHAPLVGSVLEISERPLADRLLRIDGQDGIMVARPR